MTKLKPIHPGEILREEFVVPFGLNPNKLALALRVPPPSIYEIVKEERGISSEMALRLARFFGTTPEFWINLQAHYDLFISRRQAETKIKRDVHPMVTMKSHRYSSKIRFESENNCRLSVEVYKEKVARPEGFALPTPWFEVKRPRDTDQMVKPPAVQRRVRLAGRSSRQSAARRSCGTYRCLHDENMAAAILDRVLERGRFIHLDGPSWRTRQLNREEILLAKTGRVIVSGT